MDCPFCGKEGKDNRCYECGMNKDSYIIPVKEAPVAEKVVVEPKRSHKKK